MEIYIAVGAIIVFWACIRAIIKKIERAKVAAVVEYERELRRQLLKAYLGSDKFRTLQSAFASQDYFAPEWKATVLADQGISATEFNLWRQYGQGLERHAIVQNEPGPVIGLINATRALHK